MDSLALFFLATPIHSSSGRVGRGSDRKGHQQVIGARLYPGATLRSDIPIVDTEIGTTYILILVGDVLNDN